jgi:hypothetical protein
VQQETEAEKITRLERVIEELKAENERLRRALEEALAAVGSAASQLGPRAIAIAGGSHPRSVLVRAD